jgi:hypothetical protein
LTGGAAKRDIMFLVADKGMEQVVSGFLGREQCHRSLGCAQFAFDPREDMIVSPTNRGCSSMLEGCCNPMKLTTGGLW